MVNFGPLASEIVSLVWGTPGNFNGFRVLAALLHGTLVVGGSHTAALNRGRHLYSAGRPSRWALADISSFFCCYRLSVNKDYQLLLARKILVFCFTVATVYRCHTLLASADLFWKQSFHGGNS